jgi:hypothetical protein
MRCRFDRLKVLNLSKDSERRHHVAIAIGASRGRRR